MPQTIPPSDKSPTGGGRARVLLADDHTMLLDMLCILLEPEFEVVGCATDGMALLEMAQRLQPDIALIDVVMPRLNGLDAGHRLMASMPGLKVIYLTMETNQISAAKAYASGAAAYLLKSSPTAELLQVLRSVARGGRCLTSVTGGAANPCNEQRTSPVAELSARQVEVLKLLLGGWSMKSAARKLGIAPRTVAFHKYRAMEMLGLQGNAELMEFGVRNGLIDAVRPRSPDQWSRHDDPPRS
jgi:DNA-binding NarL/FixJ family response regulator